MNNFPTVIGSFQFKLVAHFLILATIALNTVNLIDIQSCELYNQNLVNSNNQLNRSLEQLDNQQAYKDSELFKEKELKNRNYVLRGEQVVDTSPVEKLITTESSSYIPKSGNTNQTNIEKWLNSLQNLKTSLLVSKC